MLGAYKLTVTQAEERMMATKSRFQHLIMKERWQEVSSVQQLSGWKVLERGVGKLLRGQNVHKTICLLFRWGVNFHPVLCCLDEECERMRIRSSTPLLTFLMVLVVIEGWNLKLWPWSSRRTELHSFQNNWWRRRQAPSSQLQPTGQNLIKQNKPASDLQT